MSDAKNSQAKTYSFQESLDMCRRCKWYAFDMESSYCAHPESFKMTRFGLSTSAMNLEGLCTGANDDPFDNKRQLFEEKEPKP